MKKLFYFVLLLTGICLCTVLSGCGSGLKNEIAAGGVKYPSDGVYPMESEDTLTLWTDRMGTGSSLQTSPFGLEWQKRTGVNVTFQQATVANGSEALNLMLVSGDLPDIICANLDALSGGVRKYASNGNIIELDPYIDKYAPTLRKYLSDHPEIDKMVKSDDGHYYKFPMILETEIMASTYGLIIRKDILDKGGIAVPETIDEWYDALKYFKSIGISSPLSYALSSAENAGFFVGAYNTRTDFYIADGKVRHGYLEPHLKDALMTLNKWYDEGLLDKDIAKPADKDAKIMNSDIGATDIWCSGINTYMKAARDIGNHEFEFAAVPFPVLKKGDRPQFGYKGPIVNNGGSAFITPACKNIELAMRFLDYGYTEEGHLLFNFGTEGVSYNMVNGYPTYTDIIKNNPDGLSMVDAMRQHLVASHVAPTVQDHRYLEQFYVLPQQKQAQTLWKETDAWDYRIPPVSFTEEESQRLGRITNSVKTYADEMIFKFIMGIESFANYDAFVNQVKAYGLEEVVSIYEAAIDRYNKR